MTTATDHPTQLTPPLLLLILYVAHRFSDISYGEHALVEPQVEHLQLLDGDIGPRDDVDPGRSQVGDELVDYHRVDAVDQLEDGVADRERLGGRASVGRRPVDARIDLIFQRRDSNLATTTTMIRVLLWNYQTACLTLSSKLTRRSASSRKHSATVCSGSSPPQRRSGSR